MLSYQHGFHAGNHADVLKHTVLTLILESLLKKTTPFFYLDTHAGSGRYDLQSVQALKHREFDNGIARIWNQRNTPNELQTYLNVVKAINQGNVLRFYPGSPFIAQQLMRTQDRLVLCELHSTEQKNISALFRKYKNVHVHLQDGYAGLKAFLPPPEKRGLVLIDPAFELAGEYERFVQGLLLAAQRFPTGCIAGWFALTDKTIAARVYRLLTQSGVRNILTAELTVSAPRQNYFFGSSMVIINPPWKIDEHLTKVAPWLCQQLSGPEKASCNIHWLVPE